MEIAICFIALFAFAAWDSWLTHKENIERIRSGERDENPDPSTLWRSTTTPTRDGDGGHSP